MIVLWLLVWLINDTPNVVILSSWNNWGIALVVCIIIDVLGSRS